MTHGIRNRPMSHDAYLAHVATSHGITLANLVLPFMCLAALAMIAVSVAPVAAHFMQHIAAAIHFG